MESLPFEAAEEFINGANFKHVRPRKFEILKSYGLSWGICVSSTLLEAVYRRQEFGTLGLPRVLIHCSYDKDTSSCQKWTPDMFDICTEIQSIVEGDNEVVVELADMEFMKSEIVTLPNPMSQELSADWENGKNYCEYTRSLLLKHSIECFEL